MSLPIKINREVRLVEQTVTTVSLPRNYIFGLFGGAIASTAGLAVFLTFRVLGPTPISVVEQPFFPPPSDTTCVIAPVKVEEQKKMEKKSSEVVRVPITSIIPDKKMLAFLCKDNFLQRAYGVQKETGLDVATIAAQKYVESGGGSSKLTQQTKNLGNIKCFNPACQKANIKLTRKGQKGSTTKHCVQYYDDVWNDRFLILKSNWEAWNTYKGLIGRVYHQAASQKTIRAQFTALKKRGYATAGNYVEICMKTVNNTNLLQLQHHIDAGHIITTQTGQFELLNPNQ
jgi:flagellum-specific peptidoglycan hydrolase FlgJ